MDHPELRLEVLKKEEVDGEKKLNMQKTAINKAREQYFSECAQLSTKLIWKAFDVKPDRILKVNKVSCTKMLLFDHLDQRLH